MTIIYGVYTRNAQRASQIHKKFVESIRKKANIDKEVPVVHAYLLYSPPAIGIFEVYMITTSTTVLYNIW